MPFRQEDYDLTLREGVQIPYVEHDGVRRMLASFPSLPAARATVPTWASAYPVLPESDWRPISIDDRDIPILDQGSHSSCTGQACSGALMRMRAMMGQPVTLLSPTYPYCYCNNGRDAGAMIGDVVKTLKDRGTCPIEHCGQETVYATQLTPAAVAASIYKVESYYRAETFADLCSGLTLGWAVVYALQVGNAWSVNEGSLDKDGCPPVYKGPGNHALCGVGLTYSETRGWLVDGLNSWGPRWGRNGHFHAAREHFEACAYQDAYLIRLPGLAPGDLTGPTVTDTSQVVVIA